MISPFARVNIPVGSTFLIGIGPYLTLGSVTMQGSASPIATDIIRITRFGGEVVFAVNSLWMFNPFLRLGVGSDDFTQVRQTAIDTFYTICIYYCVHRGYSSSPAEIKPNYGGWQYQIFFGTSTRIWQNLKWYWQLGVMSGGGNVKAIVRDIKIDGYGQLEQPVTVTYESHIGFVIGAGIAYEF